VSGREGSTDPLSRARSIRSTADARALYAEWASAYDDDVFGRMHVTGSATVADLLAEYVEDPASPVVDVGCGTGAVGVRLSTLGYTNLTGFDLSPEMLAIASATGVYRSLVAADLNHVPVHGRPFGASVSAGTFLGGHLGGGAVAQLVSMLRPGAVLAWSVAPSVWPEVEAALLRSRVTIRRDDAVPIRAGSDDRAHLVVGCTPG
jgi:predicted TPR repeat methyltransferase